MIFKVIFRGTLVRFLIVGGGSTACNYGIYAILYLVFMVHYGLSFIIGYLSGVTFAYFLNRAWTFRITSPSYSEHVWGYFLVYLISLIVGFCCIKFLVVIFYVDPLLANLITIFITTFLNYIGTKFWVFC